ncbi:MAG: 50S ribosomal protein L4 [Halanaerobiales bacterium]
MPQVEKYNMAGQQLGEVELPETVFNEDINEPVVHRVVNAQLAAHRQGTASTKVRSEVRGGGRKPWRQKGTGRARHGSIRSPLWVGGGVTFGPKPRSYEKNVSKKEKRLALRSVLTDKAVSNNIMLLDQLDFEKPKTKLFVELLEHLNLEDKKVLFLLPDKNENVYLSARNIPGVKTMVLDAMNAYDLLDNEYIVMPEAAIARIEEVLA